MPRGGPADRRWSDGRSPARRLGRGGRPCDAAAPDLAVRSRWSRRGDRSLDGAMEALRGRAVEGETMVAFLNASVTKRSGRPTFRRVADLGHWPPRKVGVRMKSRSLLPGAVGSL